MAPHLWHNHDIPALKLNDLGQILAFGHNPYSERKAPSVRCPYEANDDIAKQSERRIPASYTQWLHDIDARIDDKFAGLCYLANDTDLGFL